MANSKVALGLDRLTLDQKSALLTTVAASMDADPRFAKASPSPADARAACDKALQTRAKRDLLRTQAKQATTDYVADEADFDKIFTGVGAFVETIAQGSAAVIQAAGMPASADTGGRPDPHALTAPTALAVTMGDTTGEIDAHWHSVKGARGYEFHYGQDGPDHLDHHVTVFKSKVEVTGLVPGKEVWGVVYALGTAGKSGPSQPARCMAP